LPVAHLLLLPVLFPTVSAHEINQITIKMQIYIAPYIASESEALGLGLDRIDYVKQFSLLVTLKTRNIGASSAVMSQIASDCSTQQ